MWWPRLDQDHVAGHQTRGVCSTAGIWLAPEHHWAILVLGIAEDLMKLDRKLVQVADMQRTKVRVECVIYQGIVDSKVYRSLLL